MSEQSDVLTRFIEMCGNLKSSVAKMTDQDAELEVIKANALIVARRIQNVKAKMSALVMDIYNDVEVDEDRLTCIVNNAKQCQRLYTQLNEEETKNTEYTKHYMQEQEELKNELLQMIDDVFEWPTEDVLFDEYEADEA